MSSVMDRPKTIDDKAMINEVRELVEDAENRRADWVDSHNGPPFGKNIFSFCRIVFLFASKPIPMELASMVQSVEQLGESLCKFFASCLGAGSDVRLETPDDSVWNAWEAVKLAMDLAKREMKPPVLETVAELLELPGMQLEQIARMHGLDVSQVMQEKKSPGSVCGPEYVPPIFAKRQAERERQAREWSNGVILSQLANRLRAMGGATLK